jgi:hypothetical protein
MKPRSQFYDHNTGVVAGSSVTYDKMFGFSNTLHAYVYALL